MKPTDWVEFAWDLGAFQPISSELPEHYRIENATEEDQEEIRTVVARSLKLDPSWNADLQRATETVERWLEAAFGSDAECSAIVLRHGQRIIGCTIANLNSEARSHLAPGPCISMEYRNRGFGSHLLSSALCTLRDAGRSRVAAATRAGATAARALYEKFGGVVVASLDDDGLLAA